MYLTVYCSNIVYCEVRSVWYRCMILEEVLGSRWDHCFANSSINVKLNYWRNRYLQFTIFSSKSKWSSDPYLSFSLRDFNMDLILVEAVNACAGIATTLNYNNWYISDDMHMRLGFAHRVDDHVETSEDEEFTLPLSQALRLQQLRHHGPWAASEHLHFTLDEQKVPRTRTEAQPRPRMRRSLRRRMNGGGRTRVVLEDAIRIEHGSGGGGGGGDGGRVSSFIARDVVWEDDTGGRCGGCVIGGGGAEEVTCLCAGEMMVRHGYWILIS